MNKKYNARLLALGSAVLLSLVSCGDDSDSTAATTTEPETESSYPLTTCVVSGEEFGSMGAPVKMNHEGTVVKLCCKNCISKFNAEPAKFAAMVKAEE